MFYKLNFLLNESRHNYFLLDCLLKKEFYYIIILGFTPLTPIYLSIYENKKLSISYMR